MSIIHIPFYPSDWLAGTAALSDAEKGVYITLFAIAAEAEPIDGLAEFSPKKLAKACGTTKKKFLKIFEYLDNAGLVYFHCGGFGVRLANDFSDKYRQGVARPSIPFSIREKVWIRDGHKCAYCGDVFGPFHLDHIFPWSKGGEHTVKNLTVACATCNLSKSDKTLEEWRGESQ